MSVIDNIGNFLNSVKQGAGDFFNGPPIQSPVQQQQPQNQGGFMGALTSAGQGIGNTFNPPVMSPIPQAPPPQQQFNPIPQTLQNIGNYFNPTSNGGNNFWSSPVARPLVQAGNIANQGATDLGVAKNFVTSAVPGLNNLSNNVSSFVQHPFTPLYKPGSSPADAFMQGGMNQLGASSHDTFNMAKGIPQFVTSGIASPVLTVRQMMGGSGKADLGPLGQQQSLQNTYGDYRSQGTSPMTSAILTGAQELMALGGLKGSADFAKSPIHGKVFNAVRENLPRLTEDQAHQVADQFIRDEAGRFMGIKKAAPVTTTPYKTNGGTFYNDPLLDNKTVQNLRQSLGLPEDGNYNQGFIRISDGEDTAPTDQTSKATEQQLQDALKEKPGQELLNQNSKPLMSGGDTSQGNASELPYKGSISQPLSPDQAYTQNAVQNMTAPNYTPITISDGKVRIVSPQEQLRGVMQRSSQPGESAIQARGRMAKMGGDFEAEMDKQAASYPSNEPLQLKTALAENGINETGGLKTPPPQLPPPESLPLGESIPNTPPVDSKLVAEEARRARFASSQTIDKSTEVLAEQAKQVLRSPKDNLNFRLAMETPSRIEEFAKQSKNSEAFKELAKSYSDYTDGVLKLAHEKGVKLNTVQDYFTHIWDLSTPEAQAKFDELMTAKAKNFSSKFTKERIVATIQDGLDYGLKLKNDNVSQDIADYGRSMSKQVSASALNQKINELSPNSAVNFDEAGTVPSVKGKAYLQSNVPGNQGTFIHPDIQAHLGTYNPSALADIKVIKAADKVNSAIKTIDLGLGGFHALKTTARQVINDPTVIPRAIKNAIVPSANRAFQQKALKDGVFEYGSKIGVTFDKNGDVLDSNKSVLDNLKTKNPLEMFNKSLFGGLINTYKINVTRGLMSKYDLTNPVQLQQARKLGAQINDLFGGLNYEILNRNKTVQQVARLGVLAPDFNEGKIRQVAMAFNPKNYVGKGSNLTRPAAAFALKNVAGEAIVMGTLGLLGTALATGKFDPSLKNLLSQAIIPSIHLPDNSTFNNPKSSKKQIAKLPGNDITDILGASKDPLHFIEARGATLPALFAKLASGKDYYGRQLVDPNGNEQDNMLNRLKASASNTLPIPVVQGLKVAQGKETLADAAINTLGGKISNDPNDPKNIQQTKYFTDIKTARDSLKPNDQVLFDSLHPTKKDYDGNPIPQNTLISAGKYNTLLENPTVLAAEVKFQKSQASHDPLWDLPDNQRQLVLASRDVLPGQPSNFKNIEKKQSWYPAFQQAESKYLASLPASTTPNQNAAPRPSQYVSQQLAAKNYADPQVKAYFTALDSHNNSLLTQMGLPPIVGTSSNGYLSSSKGGGAGGMSSSRLSAMKRNLRRTIASNTLKIKKGGKSFTFKSPSFKAPKMAGLTTKKQKGLGFKLKA